MVANLPGRQRYFQNMMTRSVCLYEISFTPDAIKTDLIFFFLKGRLVMLCVCVCVCVHASVCVCVCVCV